MVDDLAEQVKAGSTFSSALKRRPREFSPLFVNMIRASEATGSMGSMLRRVCQYMQNEREIRKQVAGAMIYPIGLLGFSVTIVMAMMLFVLPRFEKIYEGKDAVLPLPTRIMLGASNFLIGNWVVLGIAAVAAVAGLIFWKKSPGGRATLDRLKIRAPLFGPLYTKLYVSRSLRTLGTMLSSGVEMLEALEITAGVVGNEVYARMWRDVATHLSQGETLTDQLFAQAVLPRSIAQMIASGEKSGRLSEVMERVSDFCEGDLKIGVKSMTTMIEPLMIITMGLIVGAIAIALLLPIFKISNVVAG
jgi:type IV pilus assembly protein PilC